MIEEDDDLKDQLGPEETGITTITKTEIAIRNLAAQLTPKNPDIIRAASNLRMGKGKSWHPETLVLKMQEANLSVIEQHLYIEIVAELGLRPKSFRKILDVILEDTPLSIHDLKDKAPGPDRLIIDRKFRIQTNLKLVLEIVERFSIDWGAQPLTMTDASKLVLVYGEHAEGVLGSIASNLEEIKEILGIKTKREEAAFSRACKFLTNTVFDYCHSHAVPYPISLYDFLQEHDTEVAKALKELQDTYEPNETYYDRGEDNHD